jgi:hypothetical protein
MFVQISPPGARSLRQQGGWDWLSRPLVLSPTNDIEISDARVHEEGAGGRQYVVFGLLQQRNGEEMNGNIPENSIHVTDLRSGLEQAPWLLEKFLRSPHPQQQQTK